MTVSGDVEITIQDGAAGVVVVPASSVQVVIGTCSGGTANLCVASRDANALATSVGKGPSVDQAAMSIAVGATAIHVKAATTTAGAINAMSAKTITAVSLAAVITSVAHGLTTGQRVTVAAVGGAVQVNATKRVTVLTADTFTLNGITVATAYTSGGTATPDGVMQLGTGTSEVTVTGNPYDAYLVKFLVTVGGTIGTTGIRFKLSLDAGRTYGPELALGTATSYAITGTGLTLAFGAGTLVAADTATFGCIEPLASVTNVQAALNALEASPYSTSGWGSLRICGPRSGADASSIQGYLDTLVALKTWPSAIIEVRDNALPPAYGGTSTAETDAVWAAAIALDTSAVSAKRIAHVAGNYNMNSMYPVAAAGTPRMRRNGAYALACRAVTIQPQTHHGRVSDGSLAQIIVDPTNDPGDGFNYHDEHNAPSLDVARFVSFRRRKGKGGFFVVQPRLMAPGGSIFAKPQGLPLRNVMDIGCSLLNQLHDDNINSDIRLNTNGTIDEIAAQGIEIVVRRGLTTGMFDKNMISGFAYTINRATNVRTTDTVAWACTFFARGYILEIDGTVGYGTQDGG